MTVPALILSLALLAQAPTTPEATSAATAAATAAPQASANPEATAASAEVDPVAAGSAWYDSLLSAGALGYMIEGGIFMWPILVLGVIAAGVIIERVRSLQMLETDSTQLRQEVLELLERDETEAALAKCDASQGPVAAILGTGLRKLVVLKQLNYDAARIQEQVVKAMDDYGVHIAGALEKNLPILATISSVAPMLGFLGTVQGMVVAFADIVAKMGEMNIVEAAAGGIKVSLLTTVLGLIVGIPAFIGFNYFTSLINSFVLDVELAATQLIDTVTLRLALRDRQHELAAEQTEVHSS